MIKLSFFAFFITIAITAYGYVIPVQAQEASAPIPLGVVTPAAVGDQASPASTGPDVAVAIDAATAPLGADSTSSASADQNTAAPTIQGEVNPNDIPSLLFTFWEYTAIVDAKRSRGLVRPPTEAELMRDIKTRDIAKVKPPPEERDIALGGIVYVASGDWTIWLNNKRVTPKAIPPEVMDLKVSKEYIEFKWFDDYTNQIFPIRLRPHQRFNIDTRIFLPG